MTTYFVGTGTAVNVLAIVAGGFLGMLLRGGLGERYQQALIRAMGVCTIFVGASGVLEGMAAGGAALGMIVAMVLGTLTGEFLDFEGRLEHLGRWLRDRVSRGEDGRFVEGFVTASLVVCVGAMAIVGSLEDAISHDPSTLFIKAILDFIIILVFASIYGLGAVFSAVPVGLLQGFVTLCAGLLAPVFSDAVVANLSLVGSLLIFCVGANLAFESKFRVANMLPALLFGAVYVSVF